ncbi:hypothetical protein OIU84_029096 [Salix udensis]|uniref:Uncharacterized protein n=1 Tax=Salix udensis TaxID=889485 RepID=A0AAD6J5Z0_9ROSI|nr:hypothetical protein OIU84_029096 [Salix udensis]
MKNWSNTISTQRSPTLSSPSPLRLEIVTSTPINLSRFGTRSTGSMEKMSSSSPISKRKAPTMPPGKEMSPAKLPGWPRNMAREKTGDKDFGVTIDDHCYITLPPGKGFDYKSREHSDHGCRWTMYSIACHPFTKSRSCVDREGKTEKARAARKRPKAEKAGILVMQQTPRLGRPGVGDHQGCDQPADHGAGQK